MILVFLVTFVVLAVLLAVLGGLWYLAEELEHPLIAAVLAIAFVAGISTLMSVKDDPEPQRVRITITDERTNTTTEGIDS